MIFDDIRRFVSLEFLKFGFFNFVGRGGGPKRETTITDADQDTENTPPTNEEGSRNEKNLTSAEKMTEELSNDETSTLTRKMKTRSMSTLKVSEDEPSSKKRRSSPEEDIRGVLNGSVSNQTVISSADSVCYMDMLRRKIAGRFREVAASLTCQPGIAKTVTTAEILEDIRNAKEANAAAINSGKVVGRVDRGTVVMASPEASAMLPDVSYIQENRIDAELLSGAKKVDDCNCVNGCSPDCPCIMASIIAGRAFLFKGYLQADCISGTKGTGFQWDVAANACSATCRCNGRCNHGINSLDLVTAVQLRYISPDVGYGVFATKPILKGKVVFEFTGEVSEDVRDGDYAFKLCAERKDAVLMDYDTYWKAQSRKRNIFVDPSKFGNIARFVNHAQVTNLAVVRCLVNDQRPSTCRLFFYATKDITIGSELLVDYGPNYVKVNFGGRDCMCRHPICSTNSNLAGFSKYEIAQILEESDKTDEQALAAEGKTFSAIVQRWSTVDQRRFSILTRALSARFSYYNNSSDTIREAFCRKYLVKPKPLGWKDTHSRLDKRK